MRRIEFVHRFLASFRPRHEPHRCRMRTHDSATVSQPSGVGVHAASPQRHPIATTWGRSDLASSDMMSMETTKRVWQARLDPRRNTPSIGIYSHVHNRWGIFHAQPFVLNERQAGVAIEGVVRQERIETTQLAVDSHVDTAPVESHSDMLAHLTASAMIGHTL